MNNESSKFCPNCGKELTKGADVCLNCGKSLNQSKNTPSSSHKQHKGFPWWGIVLIVLGCLVAFSIFFIFVGYISYQLDTDSQVTNSINNLLYDNNVGTIGDTLTYDDELEITLDKALIYDKLEGEIFSDIPSSGNEYLILYFTVKNVSDVTQNFNYFYSKGYVDDVDAGSTKLLFNKPDNYDIMSGNIEPGRSKQGYLAYEVPTDFESFDFVYRIFDDDEYVKFTVLGSDDTTTSSGNSNYY